MGANDPLAGSVIRRAPEDFLVEELPLYAPTGSGPHVMAHVEKRNQTTPDLVSELARSFSVKVRDIGWAGYKDRHAVTRQWITIPGVEPAAVLDLRLSRARVLEASAHRNKIKMGHLKGNRFTLVVREVSPDAVATVGPALEALATAGLPNRFGLQRFGSRQRNHVLGEALVRDQPERVLALLSEPDDLETPLIRAGRQALGKRAWDDALRTLPRGLVVERHIASAMGRRGMNLEDALRSLPRRPRDFLVSAWQSACFNGVLAHRMDEGLELLAGDVAMKLTNGACFLVDDVGECRERIARQEVSVTGPLPGPRMMMPTGPAGELESRLLAAQGFPFESPSSLLPRRGWGGARRALRVPVADVRWELREPDGLVLGFSLPRGSYATRVLAELGWGGREGPERET